MKFDPSQIVTTTSEAVAVDEIMFYTNYGKAVDILIGYYTIDVSYVVYFWGGECNLMTTVVSFV